MNKLYFVAGLVALLIPLVSEAQGNQPQGLFCPMLNSDLKRGDYDENTGGQVTELQRFLVSYYDLDPSAYISGYFGRLTQENVQRFQREKGLPSFGYVGPLTRAAIAGVCEERAYSQGLYYSQGGYNTYSQSTYYSQSAYYSQAGYYAQAAYYSQSNYYSQSYYYSQASYAPAGSCSYNGQTYLNGQYSTLDCSQTACWNSGRVYVCRAGSMRWENCGWGNLLGPRDPLSCEGGTATKKQ